MEFSLKGKTSNLNLIFDTDLANSWFFLQGNLYEKNTSINTPFQFTSEFYQGYEEGESWSEGKQDKEVFLNEIKPGDYVLNLEMETDPANKLPGIELTIVHDVPMISNYGIILILMSIPLIAVFFFERSFETRRWQDSDFNPYFVFEGSDSDY